LFSSGKPQPTFDQRLIYLLLANVTVALSHQKPNGGNIMNMQAIGRKISALRKERDMTQVDLADKLGVTYQAVSSWERGNSMPDIAKLPDISQVLAVSIDELLENEKAIEIVKNVLSGQEATGIIPDLETLADVAPILKPSQVSSLAKQTSSATRGEKINVDGELLIQLSCMLESEDLREIVLSCEDLDGKILKSIAPFMESEDLREVALNCVNIKSKTIAAIACHMESEDLREIALRCEKIDATTIASISCYMESEDLREVALLCNSFDNKTLVSIAAFMESEDLKEVALRCENIDGATIESIACHMESEDLKEVALRCENIDKKTIAAIAHYMDSDDLVDLLHN